jgi:hypothetical protein
MRTAAIDVAIDVAINAAIQQRRYRCQSYWHVLSQLNSANVLDRVTAQLAIGQRPRLRPTPFQKARSGLRADAIEMTLQRANIANRTSKLGGDWDVTKSVTYFKDE